MSGLRPYPTPPPPVHYTNAGGYMDMQRKCQMQIAELERRLEIQTNTLHTEIKKANQMLNSASQVVNEKQEKIESLEKKLAKQNEDHAGEIEGIRKKNTERLNQINKMVKSATQAASKKHAEEIESIRKKHNENYKTLHGDLSYVIEEKEIQFRNKINFLELEIEIEHGAKKQKLDDELQRALEDNAKLKLELEAFEKLIKKQKDVISFLEAANKHISTQDDMTTLRRSKRLRR